MGDTIKVRCVDAAGHRITEGRIYEAICDNYVELRDDIGRFISLPASRFVPVDPGPAKVKQVYTLFVQRNGDGWSWTMACQQTHIEDMINYPDEASARAAAVEWAKEHNIEIEQDDKS